MSADPDSNIAVSDGFVRSAFPSATKARESSPSDNAEDVDLPRNTHAMAAPNGDNPASEPDDDSGGGIAPTNTRERASRAGRLEAPTDVAPHGVDSDGSDNGVRPTATGRPATRAAARTNVPAAPAAPITSRHTDVKGPTTVRSQK